MEHKQRGKVIQHRLLFWEVIGMVKEVDTSVKIQRKSQETQEIVTGPHPAQWTLADTLGATLCFTTKVEQGNKLNTLL